MCVQGVCMWKERLCVVWLWGKGRLCGDEVVCVCGVCGGGCVLCVYVVLWGGGRWYHTLTHHTHAHITCTTHAHTTRHTHPHSHINTLTTHSLSRTHNTRWPAEAAQPCPASTPPTRHAGPAAAARRGDRQAAGAADACGGQVPQYHRRAQPGWVCPLGRVGGWVGACSPPRRPAGARCGCGPIRRLPLAGLGGGRGFCGSRGLGVLLAGGWPLLPACKPGRGGCVLPAGPSGSLAFLPSSPPPVFLHNCPSLAPPAAPPPTPPPRCPAGAKGRVPPSPWSQSSAAGSPPPPPGASSAASSLEGRPADSAAPGAAAAEGGRRQGGRVGSASPVRPLRLLDQPLATPAKAAEQGSSSGGGGASPAPQRLVVA